MVSTDTLRACLHEGGRPQVGEVTTLAVVAKKKPAFICNLTTLGSRGEVAGAPAMIQHEGNSSWASYSHGKL